MTETKVTMLTHYMTLILKPLMNPGSTPQFDMTVADNGKWILYTLKVPEEDKAMVIGRNGETIRAIKTLVGTIAHRQGLRVEVAVI